MKKTKTSPRPEAPVNTDPIPYHVVPTPTDPILVHYPEPNEIDKIVSALQRVISWSKLAGIGMPGYRLMDCPMFNGKTMGDCTGAESREMSDWLQDAFTPEAYGPGQGDYTVVNAVNLRALFDARPELLTRYRRFA